MQGYLFDKKACEAVRKIARSHGLWALPPIILDIDPSLTQIGSWQFLCKGAAFVHGDKAIVIFIHQIRGISIEEVSDRGLKYREGPYGRRKLIEVLAHEICHIIDGQKWWYGLAQSFYPTAFTPDEVLKMTPARTMASWFFRFAYWINPLELRARAYSLLTWRKYYCAVYGLGYIEDCMSSMSQDITEVLGSSTTYKLLAFLDSIEQE